MVEIERRWRAEVCLLLSLVAMALGVIALVLCLVVLGNREPLYSAAMDAVTSFDGGDLGRCTSNGLSPVFNLTLRMASRSIFYGDCIAPGTVVEVSYAGVPLAAGPVQRFCTKRRGAKELHAIVEWGTAVQVPGFALDGLAADARRRAQVFDVTVTMPVTYWSNHDGKMVSCRGLRAGDAASLGATCAASDVYAVVSLPRPSGKDGCACQVT